MPPYIDPSYLPDEEEDDKIPPWLLLRPPGEQDAVPLRKQAMEDLPAPGGRFNPSLLPQISGPAPAPIQAGPIERPGPKLLVSNAPSVATKPPQAQDTSGTAQAWQDRTLSREPVTSSGTPVGPSPYLSLLPQVGRQPQRSDAAYLPKPGLKGRLSDALTSAAVAGSRPVAGGTPGMEVGSELGNLAGGFLGGLINPKAAGLAKFQRDFGMWTQQADEANKIADQRAQALQRIAQATGKNPVTGENLPKSDLQAAQAEMDRAHKLYYESEGKRKLSDSRIRGIDKLEKWASKGDELGPEAEQALREAGINAVRPTDPKAPKTVFVENADGSKSLMEWSGGGWHHSYTIGPQGPYGYGYGLRPPQAGAGAANTPGLGPPGAPITSAGAGQVADANPYGEFKTREAALGRLAGHRANWESTYRAWDREKQEMAAIDSQLKDMETFVPDPDATPNADKAARRSWETKKARLESEKVSQRAKVDKYEDSLSKIEAEVHGKYDELAGGKFITWRPGEHAGWAHDEKALPKRGQANSAPMGSGNKSGKLPGYFTDFLKGINPPQGSQ